MSNRKVRDRNAPLTVTRPHEPVAQQRAEIDAAFAGMAEDMEYQSEARLISAEFIEADWEALRDFEMGDETTTHNHRSNGVTVRQ
jgi:hypothetical protein